MTLLRTIHQRSGLLAARLQDTTTGRVTHVYTDAAGNVIAADVRAAGAAGSLSDLRSVPNATTIKLNVGMDVTLNYQRGSRLSPQIIGVSGAEAAVVASGLASALQQEQLSSSSSAPDLSGIPFLMQSDDLAACPDAYTENPGANVLFVDAAGTQTSGGQAANTRAIHARPLVLSALPGASWTASLPDGTLVDLIDSYGGSQGMYRLDAAARIWRRRDSGNGAAVSGGGGSSGFTAGGDLSGTPTSQTVVGMRGVPIPAPASGYLHYNGAAIIWDTPAGGSGGTTVWNETLTLSADGIQTNWNLAHVALNNSVAVYVGSSDTNMALYSSGGYSVSTAGGVTTVSLRSAPPAGSRVAVMYSY